MRPAPDALRSTLVVSVARVLGALLGLAVGILSARYFGTSAAKDCYVVAQTLPNLATAILMGGVWTTLLVTLGEIGMREGVAGQIAFTRRTLRHLTLVLVPAVLAVVVFSPAIVRLAAPGFGADRLDLSARLLRFTAFSTLGAVSFTVIRCLFETRSNFAVPCFVNLLIALGSLGTLVILVDRLGIFTLAVGPLLGMGLAVGVLLFLALKTLRDPPGFHPTAASASASAERYREFWASFLPMSIGANCGQINLMVDNAFASFLPTGSITMLGFAFVIISNAELLTIYSLAEVAFPRLVAAALRSPQELAEALRSALRYMVLLTAPLAAGALSFGTPLARLLFERGQFGAAATLGVARLLACYALEMLFMGHLLLFSRVLLARKRFGLVAWAAMGAMAANAILDYLMMRPFGVNGIALATTAVTFVHFLALVPFVRREVSTLEAPGETVFLAKVLSSATVMGAVVFGWGVAYEFFFDTVSDWSRIFQVSIGLALGVGTYTGILFAMKVEEARDVVTRLWRARFLDSSAIGAMVAELRTGRAGKDAG